MSDLTFSVSAFGQLLPTAKPRRPALLSLRQCRNLAIGGIWMLVAGLYGAHNFTMRYDIGMPELATAIVSHPQATVSAFGSPIIWCAMVLLGGLLVAVGARKARAPHDVLGMLGVFCLIGGCTYALIAGAYLDEAPVTSWYLRGLYLATLAASVMELYLFARCTDDDPARPVERQAAPWRSGHRHRF